MRSRFSLSLWAAWLLVLVAASWVAPASSAQVRIPREALVDVAEVDRVFRVGEQLERERRWGEALVHYEQALRAHPGVADLEQRLLVARLHFEVARRYADRSFLESLNQLTERDALDLYGEVLLKIHSHYVEPPDWIGLARHGVLQLEVTLQEPAFGRRFGREDLPQQAQSHVAPIYRLLESREVRSRHDLRDFATLVARYSQRELNLPPQAVILEFTCAAGASLDEYSAFLTGNQLEEILSQIEGNFVGLGIELKADQQSLLIVNVIPRGPADLSGLRAGDRILAVDGKSMTEVSTDAGADLLKGLDGTTVDLVIASPGSDPRMVQLQRQRVDVPSVENESIIDASAGIAYMQLASFQKTTERDIDATLWSLHRQGMRYLIIDLRGNPGGLLTAAVDVADKFVGEGTIVSTRGRSSGENYDYRARSVGTWRVPLIVLIDGDSASASEIFAGAIRDHRRGTVIGTRSYGKGSVQGVFPLSIAGAGLRLTTAKFLSPSGHSISRHGIQPHVLVHSVAKVSEDGSAGAAGDDPVLQAAMQLARQPLEPR